MTMKNLLLPFSVALALAGCPSDPVVSGTDSGPVGADSGPIGTDSGPVGTDAGPPAVDGGPVTADTGPVAGGACTNAADGAILASIDAAMIVGDCAMTTFGAEPATSNCIMTMTGLSAGCTACFSATVSCTVMNCLTLCLGGDTPACTMCRATNCDPAFTACSGLTP